MGKLLVVAPVLPVDVLETVSILERNDLLDCLVTRYSPGPALAKVLAGSSVTKRFAKRPVAPVASSRKVESLIADLAYYFTRPLSRTRAVDCSFSVVDRIASRRLRKDMGAILAREDSAIASFRRAAEVGVKKIYALPTAYWGTVRRLMERDEQQFPGICRAAMDEARDAQHRLERKDAELRMADFVLAPSQFVAGSLADAPKVSAKVEVLPFGCDAGWGVRATPQRKPIFLYAGNITMRKGIHRLLKAWKQLDAHRTAELRLIGDMFLDEKFLADYRGAYTHIPRLPPAELRKHYAEASAFVFNAMADGFGYVIAEAMSCGVPVIASRNSGAPDIIDDQRDGVLINYGADAELGAALEWALANTNDLAAMGEAAKIKSASLTWRAYGEKLIAWLRREVL
jgi:glycosyltransferase involved in cell wall biosynthesis